MKNKKAQLTVFIIVAIIIVATVVGYFTLRSLITQESIPTTIEPIYNDFMSCAEEQLLIGVDVLESQGGYIEPPEFEQGSRYMVFSSQLNFLGNQIPYWYYVSSNNIPKEQVPTKSEMQNQLADFIESRINSCNFNNYYEQGFEIVQGEPNAKISISDEKINLNLETNLNIYKEDEGFRVSNFDIEINSNLGKLYNTARELFDYEQDNLFLENYGTDTLRMYAPVDGVELTCSPKVWSADEIYTGLQEAIELNTQALRLESGEPVTNEKNKYFQIDFDSDAEIRFLNSQDWPNKFEVNPSDGNALVAEPIGNQEGLGILGFCYVPYHFVYNLQYPVLTQISLGEETFQFPMAVVIQGNRPREALDVEARGIEESQICSSKNTEVTVVTYNNELEPIPAEVSYECLDAECDIGSTPLKENFPQCANGYIVAKSEGYETKRELFSTIDSGSKEIFLNKLYEKEIELKLNQQDYSKTAIITFASESGSKTIIYPEQTKIKLAEGQYEVKVYVYRNSTIKLAETTRQQCIDVPQEGIAGIFGLTREKCFDITIPAQVVSNALYGGGTENYYILESELMNNEKIEINAESLAPPTSIEQLQENYILFEEKGLDITFK